MTVATPRQPNYAGQQTGTEYPEFIDEALAVVKEISDQGAVFESDPPAMSVRVKGMRYYDIGGTLRLIADTTISAIPAPTTNPRIDIIALDLTTNAFVRIQGTESATPARPAVGADRIARAEILLTVSMTEIANSAITALRALTEVALLRYLLNRANTWTAIQTFTNAPITLIDGATIQWDTNNGYNAEVTLGGNRTIAAPTNLKDGAEYTLWIFQDATGGRTLTFDAAWLFVGGVDPVLSTDPNAVDMIVARARDNKLYSGFLKGMA